jgi:hypothetical protein
MGKRRATGSQLRNYSLKLKNPFQRKSTEREIIMGMKENGKVTTKLLNDYLLSLAEANPQ